MKKWDISGFFSGDAPLVIAELGTGHGGDAEKARELVSAACEAGADCVKFQMVYADEILHPASGMVPLPGGPRALYDVFKKLEKPVDFYTDLKDYAESKGLVFLCTPFGPKSAAALARLQPKLMKIASPELNYTLLLEQAGALNVPLLLSTGVSKLSDIEAALETLKPAGNVCLLHCVTSYPAPPADYNLRVMESLSAVFGIAAGVSDHSLDPELVPALAAALGAAAIEKHFCLSRADPGLDDPIALEPAGFKRMVRSVRGAVRTGREGTIEALGKERGEKLVNDVLGDGVKRLAPSELANYSRTNRSIHALCDIKAGVTLEPSLYRSLRTEKVLRPGLPPSWEKRLCGLTARNFIPAGEGIRLEDLLPVLVQDS